MKCIHCQGEMRKGAAPFHADRRGLHLQLDAVPAWICPQCGEAFFEEQQVDAIQAALQALEAHTARLVATG